MKQQAMRKRLLKMIIHKSMASMYPFGKEAFDGINWHYLAMMQVL